MSVCSPLQGGVPHLRISGLVARGGTPSQVWPGGEGAPSPRSGGVPHPRSGPGGTPSQVWGVPHLRGTPSDQVWMGYPPRPGMGYPLDLGWGTLWTWDRVPPQTWDQVPPGPGTGYPLPSPGTRYPPRPGTGYPPRPGTGYPPGPGTGYPPQHSEEHLIRDGRYASCVHAGGLSCCKKNFLEIQLLNHILVAEDSPVELNNSFSY